MKEIRRHHLFPMLDERRTEDDSLALCALQESGARVTVIRAHFGKS